MNAVSERLAERGLSLPHAAAPAANYVPYVLVGDLLHISGQIAVGPNGPILGRLGANMDVAGGQEAARHCALALLAQAEAACDGDLTRIRRVVKLGGFVSSAPDFTEQHLVINGASDLIVDILGDAGRHARAAVGVAALPFGVAVEIDAIMQVAPAA